MAQKNRANMLTDIVNNIYNNLINFITGQNAQDRFVNLLDSSPNILSDASQPNGYVSTDANNEMFSSYYDEEISRADLITDLTANLAVGGKFYRINDAVGATITLLVIAESNLNLYSIGTDIATGEQGTYDITTDVFTPIVVSGTPDLQQVTDVGFTTTNKLISDNGAGGVSSLNGGTIDLTSGGATVNIDALLVTTTYNAQLPDKLTSPQTFAMLSDITSGVASVNSGTNISVDNTDPANPIINSLSDRYSTSSISTNDIDNGNGKVFTVDADLAYIPLQEVLIVNDPTHHMHGTVVSYSGTTLTVDINSHTGGGTFSSWVINLDGVPVDAITGVGTANEIAYFTAGQVIASLDTATYPSLTELALVKGVSGSDIQTQINGKMTNPMTTGGDVIYGGASGVPTRLANGTAGQILQSNGTTLAPSWVAAPSGTNTYAFNVISQTLAAPLDATSYHFGLAVEIPASTTLRREFKFPQAGTMTAFSFNLLQVTNGSNETCTLYLRNTTTSTDYTIGTFTSDFGLNGALKTLFSGLSIAVNTTDNWAVKILTPTWTTNPTSWIPVGIISITT